MWPSVVERLASIPWLLLATLVALLIFALFLTHLVLKKKRPNQDVDIEIFGIKISLRTPTPDLKELDDGNPKHSEIEQSALVRRKRWWRRQPARKADP